MLYSLIKIIAVIYSLIKIIAVILIMVVLIISAPDLSDVLERALDLIFNLVQR